MNMDTAALGEKLRIGPAEQCRACIGLDGFVDRILRVVDVRYGPDDYRVIRTLAEYGQRLVDAAGMSLNIELVPEKSQLGGNGPIMAYALARLGGRVSCIGAFGLPEPAAAFEKLCAAAQVYSVAEHADTDAYEFEDGKIIASVLDPLNALDWEEMCAHLPAAKLRLLLEEAKVIALNNWTMIPHMTEIWIKLQQEVLPKLPGTDRLFFIDLADPFKRTAEDLKQALLTLGGFRPFGNVLLSCNKREALQIAAALGLESADRKLDELACAIRETLGLWCVSIHTLHGAHAGTAEGAVTAPGFYVERPKISIGGGDHFNAGLVFGLSKGLPLPEALVAASAVSGIYVRSGHSPDLDELCAFLLNNQGY